MEAPDDGGFPPHSQPASPSHTAHAAHALASFAQQGVLSAESIVPWPILESLVEDYFTFVHPLIPVPHEPTFRAALERREDLSSPTFVALLASMIGCLAASFPRRPRQHLRALNLEHLFPSSMSIIDRCHKVALEAQGLLNFNRPWSIHDAIINYLQGITTGYMHNQDSCLLYFHVGLAICKNLGLHTSSFLKAHDVNLPRMTPNGQGLEGPQSHNGDVILHELGKRTFWLLFTGIETVRQSGYPPFNLPSAKVDPYPPLPLEVDDAYLTSNQVLPQPEGHISALVGFNLNVRIFSSYKQVSMTEYEKGVDTVFDWDRQKKEIEESLAEVKRIIEELPPRFRIESGASKVNPNTPHYPSPGQELAVPHHQSNGGVPSNYQNRFMVQHSLQKANIFASQLGTRSYLVEKYFALDSRRQIESRANNENSQVSAFIPNTVSPILSPNLAPTEDAVGETDMSAERYHIIKDFLHGLGSINQVHIEPNGAPFVHKMRSIGTSLLSVLQQEQNKLAHYTASSKLMKKSGDVDDNVAPSTFDHIRAEEDLRAFLTVLQNLELAVFPNDKTYAEDDEFQMKQWVDFRGEQERSGRAGGFMSL